LFYIDFDQFDGDYFLPTPAGWRARRGFEKSVRDSRSNPSADHLNMIDA